MSGRERMFFTERLALLLSTGIPLHTSLDSLASQSETTSSSTLIQQVRESVAEGRSFSQALAAHPEAFPTTYVQMIAAAEQGGFLPTALEQLRDLDERRQELRSALLAAVTYPLFLILVSSAVIVFVLVVVFPKFEEMFTLIADQLPITTRWLMAASSLLRNWGWLVMPGLLGTGWIVWISFQLPRVRASIDRMATRLPLIRPLFLQLNLVQFLRVMGLSLANGIGILEALRAARETLTSVQFREFSVRLEEQVSGGRGMARTFEESELIPPLVAQMLATAEESGSLASVMTRLADFYEREWRQALQVVARIAEPALLIVMGGVVGLIVSSLILPIFKISRAVH
jgi:type II secretory pathway component PulF